MGNSTSHALPYPIQHARFSLSLAFRVTAGTPTDPTTPDTEFSIDGGATFTDCAEEITTGGANGMGYLTLTGAETNNAILLIAGKSANCVETPAILYPRALATVGSGTLSAGSAGGGTLGTLLAYDVTGCFVRTTGGTGGGGTGGANNQARKIATYNATTGAFTVVPNWETTPDNTTTYDVLLPEGVTLGMLQAINPATPGRKPVVDGNGLIDATTVKLGPTGAGTSQTARDVGANIDATISSRSTYAGGDTAGTTTLVGRLTSGRATNLDNLDATVSSRSTFAGGAVASVSAAITLPAIPANWLTAAGIAAGALNGKGDWNTTTPPTVIQIAAGILDVAQSSHNTAGTIGFDIGLSGSGGGGGGATVPDIVAGMTAAGIRAALISPITSTGKIRITQGDDYHAAGGRAIPFPLPVAVWGNLTGAAVKFIATKAGSTIGQVSGTIISGNTANQAAQVELAAADTAAATPSDNDLDTYAYSVRVTTAAGLVTTFSGPLILDPNLFA